VSTRGKNKIKKMEKNTPEAIGETKMSVCLRMYDMWGVTHEGVCVAEVERVVEIGEVFPLFHATPV